MVGFALVAGKPLDSRSSRLTEDISGCEGESKDLYVLGCASHCKSFRKSITSSEHAALTNYFGAKAVGQN